MHIVDLRRANKSHIGGQEIFLGPRILFFLGGGVLARAGQTNSATTPDLFLPTSRDRPSYGAMVEQGDGQSWLRDDDDDDEITHFGASRPPW